MKESKQIKTLNDRIVIDQDVTRKYNLDVKDIAILYCYMDCDDVEERINKLTNNRLLIYTDIVKQPTKKGREIVSTIAAESEKPEENSATKEENIDKVAKMIFELYPSGKSQTGYYWRCSEKEVAGRLKKFSKEFCPKEDFSDIDKFRNATMNYINDHKRRGFTYMRLLKYFIIKLDDGIYTSELYAYLMDKNRDMSEEDKARFVEGTLYDTI